MIYLETQNFRPAPDPSHFSPMTVIRDGTQSKPGVDKFVWMYRTLTIFEEYPDTTHTFRLNTFTEYKLTTVTSKHDPDEKGPH